MRKNVLLVLIFVLFGTAARAQVASVYVTSSSSHFTNVANGSTLGSSGFQTQYANFWTSGVGGGLTLNFLPVGPVKVGLDLRGSTRPGTNGEDMGMAGIRVGLKPPVIRLKPYIQASGGYVATRTRNAGTGANDFTNEYAAWEISGGVDIPIAPFIDFRAVEVGGGSGMSIRNTSSVPNISLFTVNTGLVVHF